MTERSVLRAVWLGRVVYREAEALQDRLVAARQRGSVPDVLLLLEHPPVITLGRGASRANVVADPGVLAARGIEVHETGRGGDVTYHGPGQLVGYPIVALTGTLRDAHVYLRRLEDALVATASAFGASAHRVRGLTGVWVGDAKLAAIGVRISTGWITSHGFALNVGPDLSGFETIVPCGLAGSRITSLARLTGRDVPLDIVARLAASEIGRALGLEVDWSEEPSLAADALARLLLLEAGAPGGRGTS